MLVQDPHQYWLCSRHYSIKPDTSVGLNKREASDMVDAFFEEIASTLEKGVGVKLSGFGNFDLREKAPRPGRNPKTGKEALIKARRVVTFHASAKLKAAVERAPKQ